MGLQEIADEDNEAMLLLSFFYINGFATEIDIEKYFEYSEKSALAGNLYAQKNLGYAYLVGDKVEKDVGKAIEWYRMASAQGDEASSALLENNEDVLKFLGKHKRIVVPNESEEISIRKIYRSGSLIDTGALERYLDRLKELNIMLLELDGLEGTSISDAGSTLPDFQKLFVELKNDLSSVIVESYDPQEDVQIAREFLKAIDKINARISADNLDARLKINLIDYEAKNIDGPTFQIYATALRNLFRKLYGAEGIPAVMKLHKEIGALGSYMKSVVHQMAK